MTNFIFYVNPELTLACLPPGAPALYSLEVAAHLTGLPPEMLRHYCRLGLLDAWLEETDVEPTFDDHALDEVRRIEHCRRHHGVNLQALPLICGLWREVDRLQGELTLLRRT
jgi:DNA-binding transcriptional MerR regulator